MSLKNRTVFISGASRGIGKAIALKLASDGANIIVAAKSTEENPKLGDNTILVTTDRMRTVYLNYGLLNYIVTRDEKFCNSCYEDIVNLKKRSTLISKTSERQRNIFFSILLNKITDRKKHL